MNLDGEPGLDEGRESGTHPLRPEARLGAALRDARQKRGISLRALAKRLYRAHSNLVEYELGHRLVPLDIVQAYERELTLAPRTLVVLHEKACLELDDEEPSRRYRPNHPSPHQTPGSAVAMEVVLRPPVEPALRDLRALLPKRTASFTGRPDELRWLAEAGRGPAAVTQVLTGLGGVGKTALALEYAHRCIYTEHSVDLAWWFVAADRLSLSAAMARVYEQLTGVAVAEDGVLTAGRLRNWLEAAPYRWLVVFDNADVPGVLDGLVPNAGTGHILITSRRSDWDMPGAVVRRLDVLPLEDSVTLLRKVTDRDDDRGARLLAQELDGLAVALQQAGAFVRKTGWDFERYLKMLRARPLSLHGEDLAGTGTTVAKVLESSLDQVTRTGSYGTLASDLFGVLAYFAAEGIPRSLFAPPAIDGETTLGGGDPLAVDLALVGLADYSLVRLEPDDAISLHRLVQQLARVRVEGLSAASDHVATAIRLVENALAAPETRTERVSLLLPHIAEVTDHATRLSAIPEVITSVLNIAAQDRLDIGQLGLAHSLLDRALAISMASLGPDHPRTLLTRNSLARSLGEGGRTEEAVARLQVVLEDRLRMLGSDHPDTLWTRHNMAVYLGEGGKAKEAIAGLQDLLEDRVRVLGPDHPDTLWTRHNLARFLGEAGRVTDAIAEFEVLLEDRRRVLGPDHPHTLSSRDGVARWLGESGKFEEAVAQLHALLEDERRLLGPDHPALTGTRNNLARFKGEAGRVTEAIAEFEVLLEDRLRLFDADHPHTLWTRHNLAFFLGKGGRLEEAISQFEVLLEDRHRVLGPDHPATLGNRYHLALFLGEGGRTNEAISELQSLLQDRGRVLGADHPATLETCHSLARFLGKRAGEG